MRDDTNLIRPLDHGVDEHLALPRLSVLYPRVSDLRRRVRVYAIGDRLTNLLPRCAGAEQLSRADRHDDPQTGGCAIGATERPLDLVVQAS